MRWPLQSCKIPKTGPKNVDRKLNFIPTSATFKLGRAIGRGTVGTVYVAESSEHDHPVAVKLLHPTVSDDPRIVERFQREIQIMQRLDHPHIIHHLGGGLMDGQFFYAMELLDHGTLAKRLSQFGPLPWPQAVAFGIQISSALQHAHNHGIIHRDLKPSNLFFGDDGRLVLGDFGIARDTFAADITADGITVGTYAYMSPEQITAADDISPSADLYSLGCVLHEMLTGDPPYLGANFAQIWEQHLNASIPRVADKVADCPPWLDEMITLLLSKDPEQRPFSARAVQGFLHQHLQDALGEQADQVLRDLPELTLEATAPRWWVLVAAVGAITVLLAIAASQ